MIKRKKDSFNREYLYYLMNDLDNPSDEVLEKLEDYRNKIK